MRNLNFKALLAEGCQLQPASLHCTERTHTIQLSPVYRFQGRDEARCMLAPACWLFSGSAHGATVPLSHIQVLPGPAANITVRAFCPRKIKVCMLSLFTGGLRGSESRPDLPSGVWVSGCETVFLNPSPPLTWHSGHRHACGCSCHAACWACCTNRSLASKLPPSCRDSGLRGLLPGTFCCLLLMIRWWCLVTGRLCRQTCQRTMNSS